MINILTSKVYVFDTSAILTYLQNEEGADVIETLFMHSFSEEITILMSIISLVELRYKLERKYTITKVDEIIQNVLSLNIKIVNFEMPFVKLSATYKSTGKMSFADACIAGTAKHFNAILVHKDPEYINLIQDIEQLTLPFKPKKI